MRSSQTASAVGSTVTSGWSSLVGGASSLWSKAQNAVANDSEVAERASSRGSATSETTGLNAQKQNVRSGSLASRSSQGSLSSTAPPKAAASLTAAALLLETLTMMMLGCSSNSEAARTNLAKQQLSEGTADPGTEEGWGCEDDKDLELFLQSDDDEEGSGDHDAPPPTSVLDMAAKIGVQNLRRRKRRPPKPPKRTAWTMISSGLLECEILNFIFFASCDYAIAFPAASSPLGLLARIPVPQISLFDALCALPRPPSPSFPTARHSVMGTVPIPEFDIT